MTWISDRVLSDQQLLIRIDQCLALAMASPCARSKYGAMLLDPEHNIVLLDGYNRPAVPGRLCSGGNWCERAGLQMGQIKPILLDRGPRGQRFFLVHESDSGEVPIRDLPLLGGPYESYELASAAIGVVAAAHPAIQRGQMEIGCTCAERQVIYHAARAGISCSGRWLICASAPCLACAKAIHESGIVKVVAIADRYDDVRGKEYLEKHLPEGLELFSLDEVLEMGKQIRKERSRR